MDFSDVDVTVNGATIQVTPFSDWKALNLRWVACFGDYLQVFPLETSTLPNPSPKYLLLQLPFDFSQVSFTDPTS